ncbi:hypothetical protein BRD16_09400 [Halobacteriales archaeon SW_6_65_46]|nr:MAG: hypothetical protein BRD16_09400 [Halobacteriales archaeon SW_6_65_46]
MDVSEIGSALSNDTRLNLITILLEEGPKTGKEAHELFVQRHEERRRQSIHSALETLVDADLLSKSYDTNVGGIVYEVRNPRLLIDLEEMDVELGS